MAAQQTRKEENDQSNRLILAGLLVVTIGSIAGGQIRWSGSLLDKDDKWYRSAEAKVVADSVIQYQSPQGGCMGDIVAGKRLSKMA